MLTDSAFIGCDFYVSSGSQTFLQPLLRPPPLPPQLREGTLSPPISVLVALKISLPASICPRAAKEVGEAGQAMCSVQASRRPTRERQQLILALGFLGGPVYGAAFTSQPRPGSALHLQRRRPRPKSRSSCCPVEWTFTVWEWGCLHLRDGRLARADQGPCCHDNTAVCLHSGHRWHQSHVCWLSELLCSATEISGVNGCRSDLR